MNLRDIKKAACWLLILSSAGLFVQGVDLLGSNLWKSLLGLSGMTVAPFGIVIGMKRLKVLELNEMYWETYPDEDEEESKHNEP